MRLTVCRFPTPGFGRRPQTLEGALHFNFTGFVPVGELDVVLGALTKLLADEGLEELSSLTISFLGWRGQSRCQIVDNDGFIKTISIDPSTIDVNTKLAFPETLQVRDRPDDLEFNPIAVMLGRDD